MVLQDFALLAADTARTKAYLSAMIWENMLPGMCIVYADDIARLQDDAKKYNMGCNDYQYFDLDMPILTFLEKTDIPCVFVEDKDINSSPMKNVIRSVPQKYIIYSGYGGYILKPHLFQLGKKYIHVHAGILPKYRGSTTAYYSYLQDRMFGATAIFLSEGIDEGEILGCDTFAVPKEPVNIDYVYEPYMRSRVLIKVIKKYLSDDVFISDRQNVDGAETYFIIHPVLKHIAMLGIEKEQEHMKADGEKVRTVIYTQRVEIIENYQERRDCADQRIAAFIEQCGFLPIPVPNKGELAEAIVSNINPVGIILTGASCIL